MDDLQALHDEVGFDKVRVHRDMSLEEVKDFVKQRFEHQLKSSGIDDVSLYVGRFDALYEQGKISVKEKLAEKKAVIEQREKDSKPSYEKETEKKAEREM